METQNTNPKFVIKRDKSKVQFNSAKVEHAINAAYGDIYLEKDKDEMADSARSVTRQVVEELRKVNKEEISVEEVQDIVEMVLMKTDPNVAKSYILYRNKHAEMRAFRLSLGIPQDDLKIPLNSLIVLAARYLLKDENGKIVETPKQLFERVAKAISASELKYGKTEDEAKSIEKEFFEAMTNFKFMPNSPTLMNAGTKGGQLSACFVLPVGDSIEEIYDALKYQALVHKTGGGTGFSFSRLRPRNDFVKSTSGVASGPISFMKIFDASTEEIKQGGKRRGANMGILSIMHPDVLDFIVLKEKEGTLRNFNISVGVTDEFMKALKENKDYSLRHPKDGKPVAKLNARAVWNLIVTMAWKTGDPGLIFLDRMNSSYSNPVPKLGPIESTNPCGEVPLYPFDSCNLGSINLVKMVKKTDHHYEVDWDELRRYTRLATRFLDDVVDANSYPLPQIDQVSRQIRRLGLGVMGWADLLIKLGIRYDSNEALALAEKVMQFITENARKMSEELAEERGPFPLFKDSIWARLGYKPLRNATVTTVAPTGTISIISGGCSQGIEPIFSVVYLRNVRDTIGSNLIEVNNEFESYSLEHNFYSEELMQKLANKVSIQDVDEVPEKVRRVFVTAFDISPEWHVKMQAAFQKYTDNGVSKTINFPSWATPQDIERAYELAWDLNCKGITVYRDSSKTIQVLQAVKSESAQRGLDSIKQAHEKKNEAAKAVSMATIMSSAQTYTLTTDEQVRCPECGTGMISGGGCFTCPKCAYSKCA
ncbi:MAG: adenosylcobalamin-dependent ribonucleoside-diphosphate reductase [Candidatus Marsarchaeota archaeon]|nr:adenosylcobalamin-dependent ribonucleoside-diphosphate reductase [Candidatus Marsarchaeota archaeon]